jgi:hypothetical protein
MPNCSVSTPTKQLPLLNVSLARVDYAGGQVRSLLVYVVLWPLALFLFGSLKRMKSPPFCAAVTCGRSNPTWPDPEPIRSRPGKYPEPTWYPLGTDPETTPSRNGTYPETAQSRPGTYPEPTRNTPGIHPQPTRKPPGADPEPTRNPPEPTRNPPGVDLESPRNPPEPTRHYFLIFYSSSFVSSYFLM